MTNRHLVIALLTVTAGCSGGKLNTGGVAGAAGGGTAGSTGAAGAIGAGGTTEDQGTAGAVGVGGSAGGIGGPCGGPSSPAVVELAVVDANGAPLATPVGAVVTVASIDSCGLVTCPTYVSGASGYVGQISANASRIVLAGDGAQWTLYFRNTAMPADFIKAGDMFLLGVDTHVDSTTVLTSIDQTVTLSRGGQMLVFAANVQRFFTPTAPYFPGVGLTIADAGASCVPSSACYARLHDARVTNSNVSAVVGNGKTAIVGDLSFTNGTFTEWPSGCGDMPKSQALMAGFRLPSGGTGGAGGGVGACATLPPGDSVALELDTAGGDRLVRLASTPVTVTAVDAVGHAITLAGDSQQQWTLHLTDTAMPPDFFKVGDTFDLASDDDGSGATIGWINQTLTLSRGGQLVVFAADHANSTPNLDAFGFRLSDPGPACTTYGSPVTSQCSWSRHDLRVESGTESVLVGVGQTAQVGGLTFTNGSFLTYSWCGDMPSVIRMAGFRSP